MQSDESPFLTIQEVADYLRINRKTVIREVDEGNIPAIRVGRQYRIPRTWITEQLSVSVSHP